MISSPFSKLESMPKMMYDGKIDCNCDSIDSVMSSRIEELPINSFIENQSSNYSSIDDQVSDYYDEWTPAEIEDLLMSCFQPSALSAFSNDDSSDAYALSMMNMCNMNSLNTFDNWNVQIASHQSNSDQSEATTSMFSRVPQPNFCSTFSDSQNFYDDPVYTKNLSGANQVQSDVQYSVPEKLRTQVPEISSTIDFNNNLPHVFYTPDCRKVFEDIPTPNEPMKCHGSKKNYVCSHCNEIIKDKVEYKEHIERHMSARRDLTKYNTGVPNPESSVLTLPELTIQSNADRSKARYVCHIAGCTNFYYYIRDLKAHLKLQHAVKLYVCPWPSCGKEFTYQSNVLRHLKTHTDEKNFACPQCNSRFKSSDYLRGHVYRVHKAPKLKASSRKNMNDIQTMVKCSPSVMRLAMNMHREPKP